MSVRYTLAMCTHNHADRLARTLVDLSVLRPPQQPWEVLIVDNGSRDATPELLARHAWPAAWQVRVVREEKLGLSHARNRAVADARGEYILFMDDDETLDSDWLCAYERLIDAHEPDAFGGRQIVMFEDDRPAWLRDELLGFLGELNRFERVGPLTDPDTPFYGGNFGFRRSVCEQVGGFDSMLGRKGRDNTGGEEVDFYRRLLNAGLKVWWTPEAMIYHRIQAVKLTKRYFYDLHYRMGRMEAIRKRGDASRIPPRYIFGQLLRAIAAVVAQRWEQGPDATVRKEMNVAYFYGQIHGWAFGARRGSE
ncbi:glycosyltransferase [Calidifontimicrobium sp. SYSU G02091]|uniref:glycosyltransferase family 2 protein n=1 Tax=Calidifontimicrobium sp. SYSU G02091 TaxID=2926421 RepID=UPI001F532418|nr:glycosyltransferase family 2 protein [Calidifontimicrobium sp. SYSU G02091]MCI1193143.1 glycosyltransferase [Calidifontimicrobium sp. SYSU G02091]